MNLDLNLLQNIAGAPVRTAPVFLRELTKEDKALPDVDEAKSQLKALRARHHSAARLIAGGTELNEVAAITGYSRNHLNVLVSDPTFQELLAHYAVHAEEVYLGTATRLSALANDAAQVLIERIEDDPSKFKNAELVELVKLGADRTGHGPSSTQNTNVNVNFAEKLQAARERAAQAKVIEGEVINATGSR